MTRIYYNPKAMSWVCQWRTPTMPVSAFAYFDTKYGAEAYASRVEQAHVLA